MRILVVEDQSHIAQFIIKGLREESYAVDYAEDGEKGLSMAQEFDYDLIIQDIMLPGIDGFTVIKRLRQQGLKSAIIALTAKDGIDDRIKGLDCGADDYLCKPFSFGELLARVRALLRRDTQNSDPTLRIDDLSFNPMNREVKRAGKNIDLTSKEYALLEYLLRNKNRVLTRTLILEHVWDMNFDSDTNLVDVYIRHLRSKIEFEGGGKLIHTVRGVGYVMKC